MTMGRVVRLRCCDWTLWALPWVAHEFGHVVMGDKADQNSKEYQKTKAALLERFLPDLSRLDPSPDGAKKQRRAESEIEEYLADSFGTYFMGPALPCAAIYLRLNPTTSGAGEDSYDQERAYLMVQMLSLMGKEEHDFGQFAVELWREWNSMVRRADRVSSRDAESRTNRADWGEKKRILRNLAESILRQFVDTALGVSGSYPLTGDKEGWSVAVNWANRWIRELDRGWDLTPPKNITSMSALRDALNAAWCTRVRCPEPVTPERIDKIANVASLVCHNINEAHRRAATSQPAPAVRTR